MKQKKKKYYGIVEGFFSQPLPKWTVKERLEILKFVSVCAKSINTYFYCPKDDDYVTEKWSVLYPETKLKNLKKVVDYCNGNEITFIYGFNPSANKEISGTSDTIIRKICQLKEIGCDNFCLLYDDIPTAYDAVDNTTEDSLPLIKAIVKTVNRVYLKIGNKIDGLWFCGPDYCFNKQTLITEEFKKINKNIPFIWTGKSIFVKSISNEELKRTKDIIEKNRKIIWWSNYPVNDCEQSLGTLNLGGFNGPKKKVLGKLDGIVVNPMREAYANLPFYLTFSDYLCNSNKYNRTQSWQSALNELLGDAWKSYELILREFSARNLVDSKPKYLYSKFADATTTKEIYLLIKETSQKLNFIKKNLPKNAWGKSFVKSVSPILNNGQAFLFFANKILSKRKINKRSLVQWDRFPTTTTLSRYYPEILEIVETRISLLPKYPKKKLLKLRQLNDEFQEKYKGKKKLRITKADSLRFKKAISKAVNLERDLLLELLNNRKFNSVQKIQLFSLRQNINRFYCQRSL